MPSYGGGVAEAAAGSDGSLKFRKPKVRQVSSRFLMSSSSSVENGNQASPNISETLNMQKSNSSSTSNTRKHNTLEKSGFFRGLWPSSSPPNHKPDHTLADCIGYDRARDDIEQRKSKSKREQHPLSLNRQRSCTEFSRFDENEKQSSLINKSKENHNHKPIFGGSMRYTARLKLSTAKSSDSSSDGIIPGRFSVDENSLRKKSLGSADDSESEYSEEVCSSMEAAAAAKNNQTASYSYMASTVSSRKHGIDVPSKYLSMSNSNSKRWSSDQKHENNSTDSSPKLFSAKKGGSWAWSSPGRVGSPNAKVIALTNSKPPTSPSRGKSVGNILSYGIELLKGKRTSSSSSLSSSSPLGPASSESVHQWRLLQCRLMQWRYGNARAEAVNDITKKQAEEKLLHAWNAQMKVRHSMLQKKLQLQRATLDWKLNCILISQMKRLEMWGNIERQHSSAVSSTKDCLHSLVCRIPLIHGAKVELANEAASIVRHASDVVAASIHSISISMLTHLNSPEFEETVRMVSELATVVTREKLLLEECFDLFANYAALEVRERSLKSCIMQLNLQQQQPHPQQIQYK
ncbi:QWRF motif-containing protein 3 [Andrographis paniculata]|uniref:QWRF motif-containing protein 3 n=1 Tax=Andrographis paniculata TaxID=175694 RepID=UPI0021E759D0|nr:QWRF motif-containing protein 3 [Andrographis paniculata]